MSTWLITGCSSGLGRALAREVLARGHNAVVTARDTAALQEFIDGYPSTALVVGLDVTKPAQVTAATERAQARFGSVDVLVNNAGHGYRAAVEEGNADDVDRLFATNFFGAVSMIKAVLPGMRARGAGAIVNISSIGARSTAVGSGYYAATKAALEGLSGSLQKEVRPLGISVTIVEPGGFRTDFAGPKLAQSAEPIADYAETAGKRRKENATVYGREPGDPAKAARAIVTAVDAPDAPFLLLLGEDAYDRFQSVYKARRSDVEQWRELTLGTSYAE
ncbi:oxidoreductase [Rhodococcus spongiicola]|uniref:SDR family NAD(P)-dependent oxidoreductase n=1 Tax=Rhodococcus spongiicola TaxID=2487352 RepID=A0A3S3BQ59_9NOCA|nr:oxidoreductase [Rhodococcus spongiicola]RVW06612.1 SDR family NAD(P)-dependent oxidoreductase [Rhodococcus spongiicola]